MFELTLEVRGPNGEWVEDLTEHEDPEHVQDAIDELVQAGLDLGVEFRVLVHFQI